MLERLFNKVEVNVMHVTDIVGLQELVKLQGSMKSVSTFTDMHWGRIKTGIWRGGLFVLLKGNLLMSDNKDLQSVPDSQGRRWINFDRQGIFDKSEYKNYTLEQIDKLKDKLNKKHNIEQVRKDIDAEYDGLNDVEYIAKYPGKIKQQYIKDYIDGIEKLIMSDKKIKSMLIDKLANFNLKGHDSSSRWDEFVVNEIKIEDVYISGEYVPHEYDSMDDYKKVLKKILKFEPKTLKKEDDYYKVREKWLKPNESKVGK
jgi:hypothetical protein